jgi:SAM-dependent methyltransferase
MSEKNIDERVVEDFGREWSAYGRSLPSDSEHRRLFEEYFSIFPFDDLPPGAEGFDAGCGSGRWAVYVAEKVGKLHCIDAAQSALDVARRSLTKHENAVFHHASVSDMPLRDASQDFGYSLGVLHHIPDTAKALTVCVKKLKPGAPFLVYLYYRFDNRPGWFVLLWRISDIIRRFISRLPFPLKRLMADIISVSVYWPVARSAALLEMLGINVSGIPLASYRKADYRTMRNDALDRFGTRLEQRFTRDEISDMMQASGLKNISFREAEPYWVALGYRG